MLVVIYDEGINLVGQKCWILIKEATFSDFKSFFFRNRLHCKKSVDIIENCETEHQRNYPFYLRQKSVLLYNFLIWYLIVKTPSYNQNIIPS